MNCHTSPLIVSFIQSTDGVDALNDRINDAFDILFSNLELSHFCDETMANLNSPVSPTGISRLARNVNGWCRLHSVNLTEKTGAVVR